MENGNGSTKDQTAFLKAVGIWFINGGVTAGTILFIAHQWDAWMGMKPYWQQVIFAFGLALIPFITMLALFWVGAVFYMTHGDRPMWKKTHNKPVQ